MYAKAKFAHEKFVPESSERFVSSGLRQRSWRLSLQCVLVQEPERVLQSTDQLMIVPSLKQRKHQSLLHNV